MASRDIVGIVTMVVSLAAISMPLVVLWYQTRSKRTDAGVQLERHAGLRVKLNEYEDRIAQDVVYSEQLDVAMKDVGGLDDVKREIQLALLPWQRPDIMRQAGRLAALPPRGILFHGPPGTGKTMLAKAIARDTRDCHFINIQMSSITDKWFGETNKLIRAIFTLADKLQPCILFLDEIDVALARDATSAPMQQAVGEFLTQLDGLLTSADRKVLMIACTNRIDGLHPAIQRRLPLKFYIPLPDEASRLAILQLHSEGMPVAAPETVLPQVAALTVGYSGSDLKELCRLAAQGPVRDLLATGTASTSLAVENLRSVQLADFVAAAQTVAPPVTTTTTTMLTMPWRDE